MSEDDLVHIRRVKEEREPKERQSFKNSSVWFLLASCSLGLLLLSRSKNRGHEL